MNIKKINKQITFNNVTFNNCILNAAGCNCTTEKELIELAKSHSGGIVTKSCTLNKREGNELPRYYETEYLSINSTGLANLGYNFYNSMATKIKTITTKPYIVSIAGIKYGDNLKMLDKMQHNTNIDMFEVNLSCPNIIGKSQIGYDSKSTNELLRKIFELKVKQPVGIKLPPYFDMQHFKTMSDIFSEYPLNFITCINSLGNGFVFNKELQPSIKPKNGYGGIGGSVIKPFGLSNVRIFHEELPTIPIIGCGGIQNKQDIYEYLECGATLVQIGTELHKQGSILFKNLIV